MHIVGSCRDVAAALEREPEAFAARCAGIYLNAGSGRAGALREYNVELDPPSYARIFTAPCPVYWMPCFDEVPDLARGEDMRVGRHGTFYRFTMGRVLKELSPRMQNYFLDMLARRTELRWLAALGREVEGAALDEFGARERNMWCTAGFLHAVGRCVDVEGNVVELGAAPGREVFGFEPVSLRCGGDGRTEWSACARSDRYIFTVRDTARYQEAMTAALGWLLKRL